MVILKKKLEHNDINTIAQRTGFHRDTVSKVVNGKGNNAKVIKEALLLIEEKKKEKKALAKQIAKVISE